MIDPYLRYAQECALKAQTTKNLWLHHHYLALAKAWTTAAMLAPHFTNSDEAFAPPTPRATEPARE
jgi:hypothetical protein